MKNYSIITTYKKLLADTTTPVSIYLRLRDVFPNSLLLESSDYHSRENSVSYVCCEPIAGLTITNGLLKKTYPDGSEEKHEAGTFELTEQINAFLTRFLTTEISLKTASNGLFGYFTHEAVEHFETIKLKKSDDTSRRIPEMQYHVYRYIIAIDHFKNELYIFHNQPAEETDNIGLAKIEDLIKNKNFPEYNFSSRYDEKSNLTKGVLQAVYGRRI